MIRNLRIEHRLAPVTVDGDEDHEYLDELHDALVDEYPDAEIEINLDSEFANASQTVVDGKGDRSDGDFRHDICLRVATIAGEVWNRM
jgi:hypothetical protein